MNLPPTDMDNAGATDSEAKRFTYPGGSRPLDGFTIKRGVGHGGFGEVYYATSDAGKEVALKLIRRSLDVELRGIKQCLNLKHPNLLGVFDIKEDSRGDHWVVMEYVAGECLDDAIARHPNGMPAAEALAWLSGIASGVGYLHDHGIVHRDLKPANIFSEEGHVTIGDYGLSKFISCSRRSGHTESVGTVHYMAPEIANGRYGKEIDIYALGIIFYEMLTGRLPFEGESVGEVLMKHLTAKPDVSMIAEPYRSVIARALEKDPDKRFSSVDEMLARLPVDRSSNRVPCATGSASAANPNGSAKNPPPPTQGVPCATGSASAPTPVVARPVDEEPILRELRAFRARSVDWWRGLNPGAQVAVAILGILALVVTSGYWIPLGFLALVVYGVYRLIRAIVLGGSSSCAAAPPANHGGSPGTGATPAARDQSPFAPARQTTPAPRRHYRRFRPYERPVHALIVKPLGERTADLLGSMLLAAVVAAIMTLVTATLAAALSWDVQLEVYAFILLVSIAGAWAVLVPSKLWEGTDGDGIVRRLVMMTVGIALGAFAWGAMQWLTVDVGQLGKFPEYHYALPLHSYLGNHDQFPLSTCLVVFGMFMLLVRWWRQTDPLRSTRMSLWTMGTSMLAALIVAVVWQTHGWALVTIAGIMSISVQLASPWVNPRLRQANPEE